MRNRILILAATIALCVFRPKLSRAQQPIPHLQHEGNHFHLIVDGKPYLILGGQAHNSSATNPADLEPIFNSLVAMHANTAEVPVYWELVEPEPGHFDFHLVDAIVSGARRHHLRLILLWFGTWKNGEMHYAPGWVKRDRQTYRRVISAVGQPMEIISPFCQAAERADATAFGAFMTHLKQIDAGDRTVIMVQVENETGLLGTDRDYSPEATRLFGGQVPADLMHYLEAHRDHLQPVLKAAWSANQYRNSGTWQQVFGGLAPEAFSAWGVSRYVNAVAAAGKKAYPLPFYCNNWLAGPGAARAGDWPSGGPTFHVLDIWKAEAPNIDILSPDIYAPKFYDVAAGFLRPDNPLFVPETGFEPYHAPYVYMDLATFNGIGFSPFGIDRAAVNGKLTPRAEPIALNYELLQPLLPLIAKEQYTGKLHALIQGVGNGEGWAETVPIDSGLAAVVHFTTTFDPEKPRGCGLLIELAPDDFIVAGTGMTVDFMKLQGPPGKAEILSVEDGTYQNGEWLATRRLNGDELHVSLGQHSQRFSFAEKGRILRVRLIRRHVSKSN
jgi:Domain of unknown function (DUF5597)/Glycosyl hydrolases family 35